MFFFFLFFSKSAGVINPFVLNYVLFLETVIAYIGIIWLLFYFLSHRRQFIIYCLKFILVDGLTPTGIIKMRRLKLVWQIWVFFVSHTLSIFGGFGLFHSFWNMRSHSFKLLDILGFLLILFLDWFRQSKNSLLHTLNLSVDWPLSSKYLWMNSVIYTISENCSLFAVFWYWISYD